MPSSGDLKSGDSLFCIPPHPNINDQTPLPPINTNQPSLQLYQSVIYHYEILHFEFCCQFIASKTKIPLVIQIIYC